MRRYAGVIVGLAAAVLFARLGVWQLDRRHERRELNARLRVRLAEPPLRLVDGAALVDADPDTLRFRPVRALGVFDFAREAVEIGRSYQGTPGVHILTPLRLADGVGVLVDRGWTYAADGMSVRHDELREADSSAVQGVFVAPATRWGVRPDTLAVGYPLLRAVLRRTAPPPGLAPALRIPPLPALDDGPHLSYALQWFSFALIALVGGVLLTRASRR